MTRVFLIPGMGADSRIYQNFKLDDYDVTAIDWVEPEQTDTLKSYAQKLILQYDISPLSIVIGNSLGGMLAVEIAKIIPMKKTILISSIKTVDEAPGYFPWLRALPFFRLIPGKMMTSMGFLVRMVFGKMHEADARLFTDMLEHTSPVFLKWSMDAVLKWDNKTIPQNVFIVTGDHDHVFNHKRINDAIIVKGGTHIMIFDRSEDVLGIVKDLLNK